jgi:sialidase-1
MKKLYLLYLSYLLIFPVSNICSQDLDADNYHIHRSSLKNAYLKFKNENKGRVVYLGGSITHNPGWRDSLCNYFLQKFPETDFDFINAGIPSMGSTPDAFRFERDVLKHGPVDLLFLEAAVNDDTNRRTPTEIKRGMEGIIRHSLRTNPTCNIVIMHFVDPGKMETYRQGKVPEVILLHEQVARHYNIPTINLAKEVTERIDAGEFDWENDFKNLHPSPFGQHIYYQSMRRFLEDAFNNDFSNKHIDKTKLPKSIDPFSYTNGKLVEPKNPKNTRGWELVKDWKPSDNKGTRSNYVNVPMLVGEYPGEAIRFDFKGNAVGIAVAAGPNAGIIEYRIDGSSWKKQDLFTKWSNRLYLPWYYTLASGLKSKRHTLYIRLTNDKKQESTGKKCILRYFYYNAD